MRPRYPSTRLRASDTIEFPEGYLQGEILPLPDKRLVILGEGQHIATLSPGAQPLIIDGPREHSWCRNCVLRDDGAMVGNNLSHVVAHHWWPPAIVSSNNRISAESLSAPVVGDDGIVWSVGSTGDPSATEDASRVGIAAFREVPGPDYPLTEATEYVMLPRAQPNYGEHEYLVPLSYPAMPRPGQVMFVTNQAVRSVAVPGLRPPNPTQWATAHGSQQRDRRWRAPVPVPITVGGEPFVMLDSAGDAHAVPARSDTP